MWNYLRRSGIPAGPLLGELWLPRDLFLHPEALIPHALAVRFLDGAARVTNLEIFGALLGQQTPMEALGLFGRAIAHERTLGDALRTAAETAIGFSGERFWLSDADGEVRLSHRFPRRFEAWGDQAQQYSLACTLRLVRSVAGPSWIPQSVHVPLGVPPAIAELPMLRGSTVRFDRHLWSFTMPRRLLERPLPPCRVHLDTEEERMRWMASRPADDYAGTLGQVLSTLIGLRDADIATVARWLGTSVRTLQRRLAVAGMRYADLLARTRFETAVRRLAVDGAKLRDIATELGYSDPAHFTRAFRRWSGTAPRAFRRAGAAAAYALSG